MPRPCPKRSDASGLGETKQGGLSEQTLDEVNGKFGGGIANVKCRVDLHQVDGAQSPGISDHLHGQLRLPVGRSPDDRGPDPGRDLRVHDEEIGEALRIIRSEHGHDVVVLNGHSTGGLQAVIWAADHPGTVDAVVLNSPWLDLRGSTLVRSYGSAFVDLLSRRDPERVIGEPGSGDEDNYVAALHRRWRGEWDWDLALKPAPSFPVRAGFLAGIRRLQREVHHGLGIRVPILVCCSTVSGGVRASLEEAQRSDVVLDVEQIIDRSQYLGDDVTVRQIPDGVHDLALSGPLARAEYLQAVMRWLDNRLH